MFLLSLGTTTPEDGRAGSSQFVYWNVPSFVCHKYGVTFENLEDFGIRQNVDDKFRGEKIAILYDPGMFPALLTDENGKSKTFCPKIKILENSNKTINALYITNNSIKGEQLKDQAGYWPKSSLLFTLFKI